MGEAEIDWRQFDEWRAPGFEVRLFPEWFGERHAKLLKIADMPDEAAMTKAAAGFFEETFGRLNGILWNPDLRIFGRPGSPDSDMVELIFGHNHRIVSWPTDLPPKIYESKVIIAAGDEVREYYDVYVFPFLVAPALTGKLSGFLDEVLTNRLWGDYQLFRVQHDLGDRVGALGDGKALVSISDRRSAIRPEILTILDQLKLAPEIEGQAADIIADRLSRLFSLLLAGDLALLGRDRSGWLRNVPAHLWREPKVSLCLSGAAIFRGTEIAWTDLRIGKLADDQQAMDEGLQLASADRELPAIPNEKSPALEDTGPISYSARPFTGRPTSKGRMNVFDAMIVEHLAAGRPLYLTVTNVDEELTRREACREIGIDPHSQDAKAIELDPETVAHVGDWLRGLLPMTRAALSEKGESER